MRILEVFTGIGGLFGTLLMIIAATAEGGNIEGLGNMIVALFHFGIMIIMLPFLLLSIFRGPIISKWFATLIRIECAINAILVLLLLRFAEENITLILAAAVLELLPWLLLWLKRDKIGVYEQGYFQEDELV